MTGYMIGLCKGFEVSPFRLAFECDNITRNSRGPGGVANEEILVTGEQLDDGRATTLSSRFRRHVSGYGIPDVVQVCLQVHHTATEQYE